MKLTKKMPCGYQVFIENKMIQLKIWNDYKKKRFGEVVNEMKIVNYTNFLNSL